MNSNSSQSSPSNRGGKRSGAGRKLTDGEGVKRITITLRPSDLEKLRTIHSNTSMAIRLLLDQQK